MTKEEVLCLMKSSKNKEEWNSNCDKVKSACNGYPGYWYQEVILSGLMNEALQNPDADKITIVAV